MPAERGKKFRRKTKGRAMGALWTSSGPSTTTWGGTPVTILRSGGGQYRYPIDTELARDYEEVTD